MKGKAMSGVKRFMAALTIALLFLVLTPKQAHAYIDAGTTGMIIQGLVGVLAGALVLVGVFRAKIGFFVRKMFNRSTKAINEAGEDTSTKGSKDEVAK